MPDEKPGFDAGIISRVVLCVFLGACLYLYITNNNLFTSGSYYLRYPEALVMLAVLGVPFLLSVLHLVRGRRHHPNSRTLSHLP